MSRDHVAQNREAWNRISDEYQAEHGEQLGVDEVVWGGWSIPESELGALGDVSGKNVLELGCGAARFAIKLALLGARCVGVDVSPRQLEHARRAQRDAGVEFPLVEANAEDVRLPDASFDIVFSDHGGMTWADPYRTVAEVARLLRPGGLLVFNMSSPLVTICTDESSGGATRELRRTYFGMHAVADQPWEAVEFQLPYGEWIRLLTTNGFEIEALIELRPPPDATTTYTSWVSLEWARRWPGENIWKARKRT
jgi:ubiquinone/menaquinone biosynthesis C-methylase UbiE